MATRSDGKVFQDWEWEKDGFKRTIQIRVRGKGAGTRFFAYDKEAGIRAESESVADLVTALKEKLDERYATRWELWLWVNVDLTSHTPCDYGIAPVLRWTPIAIGTLPDGSKVHCGVDMTLEYHGVESHHDAWANGQITTRRTWDGKWEPDRHVANGEPKPPPLFESQSNGFREYDGNVPKDRWCLIRGTPENVEALCIFEWDLMLLARRIAAHFTPRTVEKTLTLIAKNGGNLMLGAPKP